MLVLFGDEVDLDQFMILAKNQNITNPIEFYKLELHGLQLTFSKRGNKFTYLPYDTNK